MGSAVLVCKLIQNDTYFTRTLRKRLTQKNGHLWAWGKRMGRELGIEGNK